MYLNITYEQDFNDLMLYLKEKYIWRNYQDIL